MAYKNTKRAYYGNMGEISDMCSPFIITTIIIIIIIVSIFVSNHASSFKMFAYSNNISTTPSSFKNSIDNGMISSSALGLLRDATIMRMHNTTGMVSYVGEVNVSNLQRPLFKPLIGINSQESYLTRDFAAYKVAKNQSEIVKPSTRVFEVKLPSTSSYSKNSLQNGQWPVSSRTNLNTSSIISAKFDGLAQNCCIPPDVQVAAGTKYVVEMVNLDGAIYTENRTLLKSFGLKFLFNPAVKGSQELHVSMSDPVLLFDNASRRWFASISDMTAHSIRVAVSEADDPTGVWRIYNFPFEIQPNNCSDQPFIGVSEDKFIVTVNNWGNDCNWRSDNEPPEFRGVQFIVADKIDLLTGSGSVGSVQSESDLSYFSLHPIITLSPTPTLLVATVGDFNHNNVQVLYIDGPLYNLRIRIMSYAIQDTHVAPDGIQPTAQSTIQQITTQEPKVSTGDARIQGAIWYQEKLWLTFNDGCFIIADTKSRSCVRLIQIDTIINKVIQDFDIGAIGSSLYYPAISIDGGGNLGIIFGYSSHSAYPSILVSTQSSNDEHNSIREPRSLKLGTANELTNRYGDYFAASSDPLSDSIIWVAGEYHATATWSTYIGELYTGTLS
jgi:hypothetical protein